MYHRYHNQWGGTEWIGGRGEAGVSFQLILGARQRKKRIKTIKIDYFPLVFALGVVYEPCLEPCFTPKMPKNHQKCTKTHQNAPKTHQNDPKTHENSPKPMKMSQKP